MILPVPQKEKAAPYSPELKWKIIESVTLRIFRECRWKPHFNRMLRIAEFENSNDVLIVLENAIQRSEMAAISRHRYVAVNIEADRNWFSALNSLEESGKKIIGDWEIVFSNVVFRYLHNDNARIGRPRARSPAQEFVVCQKFDGLK